MTLLKKHLILLRSLEEAVSENLVKFSDCRASSILKLCPAAGHLDTLRCKKNPCSANYRCMTHDIYFVKARTNKQKQTDVLLYVNDGCGLNNCYSIKCNKQQEKYLCFKGKDMYFRRRRQKWKRPDRITDRITESKQKPKTSNRL